MLTQLTVKLKDENFTFGAHEIHDLVEEATTAEFSARKSKPDGNGKATEHDAYAPSAIGHWIWIAQQPPGGAPVVYYQIGGRRIFHRRNDNYMGDGGLITSAPRPGQFPNLIPTGSLADGGAWRKQKQGEDEQNASGNPMAPTYPEVLAAMEKQGLGQDGNGSKEVARTLRDLLKGITLADQEKHFMLCPLAGAMFIGEPTRNFSCLPTHLMILDIIEAGVAYSAAGLTATTWKQVLWADAGVVGTRTDGYGIEYAPGEKAKELGGLMPAGHKGSYESQKVTVTVIQDVFSDEGEKTEFETQAPRAFPKSRAGFDMTIVEQKETSVTIRWLARMIEKSPQCGLTTPAFADTQLRKAETWEEKITGRPRVSEAIARNAASAKLKEILLTRFADLDCKL